MSNTGIITKTSQQNFEDTYQKLKTIISNNPNLKIILFGNPKLGTHLMGSGTFTGLDLPQKILVSERAGVVSISYNDPLYLKERHAIKDQDEILQKVAGALDKITTGASMA